VLQVVIIAYHMMRLRHCHVAQIPHHEDVTDARVGEIPLQVIVVAAMPDEPVVVRQIAQRVSHQFQPLALRRESMPGIRSSPQRGAIQGQRLAERVE